MPNQSATCPSSNADYISTMWITHWEPPGVCQRRWSVTIEVSNSGENQTLGRDFGLPWGLFGFLMTSSGVLWEWWWCVSEDIGASESTLGTSGRVTQSFQKSPKNWKRCLLLWMFVEKIADIIWDSLDVHEQCITYHGEYDTLIIVHN